MRYPPRPAGGVPAGLIHAALCHPLLYRTPARWLSRSFRVLGDHAMAKEGRRGEVRHVSFKMPAATYQIVQAAASERGVDVSAVLNWLIAEQVPLLMRKQAARRSAMALADTEGLGDAVVELLRRVETEKGLDAAYFSTLALM